MTLTTTFLFSAFSGSLWLAFIAIGIGVTVGMLEHFWAPPERMMKERIRWAVLYGMSWGAACGVLSILLLGSSSASQFNPASLLAAVGLWGLLSSVSAVGSLQVFFRAFSRSTRFT